MNEPLPTDLKKISWSNWCDYTNFKANFKGSKTYEYYHKAVLELTDICLNIEPNDIDSEIEFLKAYLKSFDDTVLVPQQYVKIESHEFEMTDFNLTIIEGFLSMQFVKTFEKDLFSKACYLFALLNRKANENLSIDVPVLKRNVAERAKIISNINAYDMIIFLVLFDRFMNELNSKYKFIYKSIYSRVGGNSDFEKTQKERHEKFFKTFGYEAYLKKFVDKKIGLQQSFEFGLWWLEIELNQL